MSIKLLLRNVGLLFVLSHIFLSYKAISAEDIKLVNHIEGIENPSWGVKVDSLKNLKFVKSGFTSKGEVKIYKNTRQDLKYDGIDLNTVEYGFNSDKLHFVVLKTNGVANWKQLREQAIKKYGHNYNRIEDFGYQNYMWQKDKSSIALEYKSKQDSSVVLLILSN